MGSSGSQRIGRSSQGAACCPGIREFVACCNVCAQCRAEPQGNVLERVSCWPWSHCLSQTIDDKTTWNEAFATYIHELDAKKPVIWMGDVNCAPTARGDFYVDYYQTSPLLPSACLFADLTNSKTNWNKTPGHTQLETDGFNKILGATEKTENLIDVWRNLHPDLTHYTYFSYKFRFSTSPNFIRKAINHRFQQVQRKNDRLATRYV